MIAGFILGFLFFVINGVSFTFGMGVGAVGEKEKAK